MKSLFCCQRAFDYNLAQLSLPSDKLIPKLLIPKTHKAAGWAKENPFIHSSIHSFTANVLS
jgi:hypothetical protein